MLGIPSKPTPCELGFTWSVASASRDSGSSWSRLQAGRSRDDSWLGQDPKCPIQKPILWELLAKTRVSHGKSASVLIIGCSGFPPLQTILNILKYSHMVLIAKSKSLHQIGIHGKSLYLNRELKMVTQIPWSRNPTNCSSWMFMMCMLKPVEYLLASFGHRKPQRAGMCCVPTSCAVYRPSVSRVSNSMLAGAWSTCGALQVNRTQCLHRTQTGPPL